jgi:hypothetical protein
MQSFICIYITHIHIYIYIHIYINHINLYKDTLLHIFAHIYIHIHINTCKTHVERGIKPAQPFPPKQCIYKNKQIHKSLYICIYIYSCTRISTYPYSYIYIYIYIPAEHILNAE